MKAVQLVMLTVMLFSINLLTPSCKKEDEEPKKEICGNGIDDDGNGFTDLDDLACTETGTECSNGLDDDGDGFVDCDDMDCTGVSGC